MRTGIEQARLDLAKWEARVAQDEAALATAESHVAHVRDRLDHAKRCAHSLREAVRLWDTELARHEQPNVAFSGVPAGHSSNHPAGGTSAATQG